MKPPDAGIPQTKLAALLISAFALKVVRWCGFGFAAGCAAVAMPRRRGAYIFLGYALGVAFGPINFDAKLLV